MDHISSFVSEIGRSLKCVVNRSCSFSFLFRMDVFRFLFGEKGRACPHRLGKFYDKEDFNVDYFSTDWFVCCDRLGDSCRITFPIRMHSKILWSPVMYSKDASNVVVPKKRSFKELCYVYITKQRC